MRFKYGHYTVQLCYNVTKGMEYFVLLQTSVVLTKEYNVIVNSEELLGAKECQTLQTRLNINQCCYNHVQLLPICKNPINVLAWRQAVQMLHISFSNQ
jgi:hypothetical protein